jgi:hypothetical protein
MVGTAKVQFFKAIEQVEGLIVPMLLEYLLSAMEQEIQQFLKREIEKLYPSIGKRATLEVICDLNFDSPAKLTATKPMDVNPKPQCQDLRRKNLRQNLKNFRRKISVCGLRMRC